MLRSLLVACLAVTTVGCTTTSGADPASSAPTPATQSLSASPDGGATAADRYCDGVDAFIAASQKALKDPLDADTRGLSDQARELQQQANALAGELIDDPDAISRVQGCTERLADFNAGN